MTNLTCDAFRDLLVDYADGELSDRESELAQGHLRDCVACRIELSRLQLSLTHAQAIWQQSATLAESSHQGQRTVADIKHGMAVAFAAVLVLVAAFASAPLIRSTRPSAIPDPRSNPLGHAESVSPIETTLEFAEMESAIARETRAARLGASSELLAAQPSLASYLQSADAYLATVYENTSAAEQAKQRLHGSETSPDTGPQL